MELGNRGTKRRRNGGTERRRDGGTERSKWRKWRKWREVASEGGEVDERDEVELRASVDSKEGQRNYIQGVKMVDRGKTVVRFRSSGHSHIT